MKKLVSILLVVALACTCAFAGVKLGVSVGREAKIVDDNTLMVGVEAEYDFEDGVFLFADATTNVDSNTPTAPLVADGKFYTLEAGVGYVLPFDLPFDVEIGLGFKAYGKVTSGQTTGSLLDNSAFNAKLGVSFDITEKISAGLTVTELFLGHGSAAFDVKDYLATYTGFKASVKYAF